MKLVVKNALETQLLAEKLAKRLKPQDLILLTGDLGAGKTTFTKGLAYGLGIMHNVKSPTFTLIREYHQGRLPLYHMDVYRLENGGAEDLGLEEYFNGDGVSVVEWAQFIPSELPSTYLEITIVKDNANDERRTLILEPKGDRYERLIEELKQDIV
ncbi:tRNA (adenosine(37)-N6)-threonylcarbamoyltransferase complex ATPase subunit type 1 TsaE [Ligilactobacillus sp. WILCCON 0076]|uniref:tRNA threonylcarbamoyladenosine biosynthesis protein TsaE n=1 Tax=Ligilactobacillus ubinensis TaxID=2876789 RepID=A0A9X2FKB6_9LACO|nr:tRNA (adenosine(37)-N6)-threonylcarbamoyltransferase complex ATPase subunit type 1 TsaE [Ligilactobacillus ubinensis]MCP0886326.1 tRNA (adenosine(37)-N6)-threonylcarbamoyltransferase complex ATPase subunit type 1 TsaE [Ligilactobacillus ubinensis]